MQARLHVVSLPHTQTTREYCWCAYTEKVRKFCGMMRARGYHVTLYASEENEADCDEFVTVIHKSEQPADPTEPVDFKPTTRCFAIMNGRAIAEISERIQERDLICLIGGNAQKPIADAFPANQTVEFGVGYTGVFSRFRVWESYAWMHMVYGEMYGADCDGQFYDTVIHNFFEPEAFPFQAEKSDYFLYIGRLIERKGIGIAVETCERLGASLIVAGKGELTHSDNVLQLGVVDEKRRGELMSGARAVFVPTQYVEPFGGVAVEAQLCGTPVITTDFGAFTETVENGVSGWRCHTMGEFVYAAATAHKFKPERIRKRALKLYSCKAVGAQYDDYFQRVLDLWDGGWDSSFVAPGRLR